MLQKLKNYYHLVRAIVALFYFNFPAKKLRVIGVTGTDGKTTTVHMIANVLESADGKVGYISSIGVYIGGRKADTGFHVTTPDPWQIQKFLKKMVDSGAKYAILEVTSHGLDQNRVFGCNFSIGVLTNISHEHLDYHKTLKNYLMAKAKLFKKTKVNILNIDDPAFGEIKKVANGEIITYGILKEADYNLKKFPLKLKIFGEYNLYNALAAVSVASILEIDREVILKSLADFRGLAGRMELINQGQDFKVVVDFAHTPNALKQALKTLKSKIKNQKSKMITVFGSAGLRDVGKRQLMGEISGRLSDYTVITDEDPRTEDPRKIARTIAKGCEKTGGKEGETFFIVNDRQKAIRFALQKLAKKGDVVGIFGKGHERSMCLGKAEKPWSDQEEAKKALRKIRSSKNG